MSGYGVLEDMQLLFAITNLYALICLSCRFGVSSASRNLLRCLHMTPHLQHTDHTPLMTLGCWCSGGKTKGLQQKQIGSAAALEALVETNLQTRLREVQCRFPSSSHQDASTRAFGNTFQFGSAAWCPATIRTSHPQARLLSI